MHFLSRAVGLSLFFAFFSAATVFSANSLEVVANEIAWMGTKASYNDEWIELYNNTNALINLSGWKLTTKDGKLEINLSGEISPESFFLLERTDDSTIPEIRADQIYTGPLGNDGESLALYDELGNLIDLVEHQDGWFAGSNQTKQTMERKSGVRPGSDPENWQNSQNPGGTPKAQNDIDSIVLTETLEPTKETQKTGEKIEEAGPPPTEATEDSLGETGSLQTYPGGIVINEILPSPEGPDENEEWIEIFNQNNFEVNLSGWQIKDTAGSVASYTLKQGTIIKGRCFLVLSRPETKIVLNNNGDQLNFIQPDGKIADSVSYQKAYLGLSYNEAETGWIWSSSLTPGSANIIPVARQGPETQERISEEEKGLAEESNKKKEAAAVAEHLPARYGLTAAWKNFSLFLTGLLIDFFSVFLFLLLKRKLKKS